MSISQSNQSNHAFYSLNTFIFIGAFAGLLLGSFIHHLPVEHFFRIQSLYIGHLISSAFIDLLKMVLVPLVFTSIAVGVANLQSQRNKHCVWISTLIFFISSMAIAIIIGLSATLLFEPGKHLTLDLFKNTIQQQNITELKTADFAQTFLHSLFINPFTALAKADVLAIVMFALFLGISLAKHHQRYPHLLALLKEGLAISLGMVNAIMWLAPLGILCLLMELIAAQDIQLLWVLMKFVSISIGAMLFHGIIVLPLILFLITRLSPIVFWQGAKEALITAFATSSSAATLPVTLRCMESHLKVKPDIANFVIPLGATINMDGTALYEASAAMFIANLSGIELSFAQQLIVFFTAMIAAIGAPGIPSAGMVTMVMVLQSVGLPAQAIAILLPIDRLLDTFRTAVNVEGDMIGTLIVQKIVNQKALK